MRRKAHIDIPSVALSFVGLACFLYGLNEISHEVFPPLVIMLAGIGDTRHLRIPSSYTLT